MPAPCPVLPFHVGRRDSVPERRHQPSQLAGRVPSSLLENSHTLCLQSQSEERGKDGGSGGEEGKEMGEGREEEGGGEEGEGRKIGTKATNCHLQAELIHIPY